MTKEGAEDDRGEGGNDGEGGNEKKKETPMTNQAGMTPLTPPATAILAAHREPTMIRTHDFHRHTNAER